jgi:hypothetical protein
VTDHPNDSTEWTLIRLAQGHGPEARAALGRMIERYQASIVGLIRHYRHPPHLTAEEMKQEFLMRVLAREDVLALDPAKGKFRAWLAIAVRRHVMNAWDAWWAGSNPSPHTDYSESYEVVSSETAQHALLRKFAVDTLRHAESRLRARATDPSRFEALRRFLPGPDMALDQAKAVAEELHMTPGALRKAVHDLRQDFVACLRAAVADTLGLDPDEPGTKAAIAQELRELHASLAFALEAPSR